jgi:hypothetical protein
MRQVVDDFGNVFRRGVPTPLNVHDWQLLSASAASGAFLFLQPDHTKAGACCGEAPPSTSAGDA